MSLIHRSLLRKFGSLCCAAIIGGSIVGCQKDPVSTAVTVDPGPTVFDSTLFNLRLTEIHYNPSDLDTSFKSDSLEFIEMKNIGSTTLDLGGLLVSNAINFKFPDSTMMAPGSYFVLASSKAGFTKRYGKAPDGVYSGVLKNSGEVITLGDTASDSIIFSQFYTDSLLWPPEADGRGYSLVTIDSVPARGSTAPAKAWRKSERLHGSPGAADKSIPVNAALFNLRITEIHFNPVDFDTIDGDSLEFIEFKNIGSAELPLGGLQFTNGISYAFPSTAKIAVGAYLVLVADVANFKKRYPEVVPFGSYTDNLSNGGELVVLADTIADTAIISIDFKDSSPWPSISNNDGYSLVTVKKNPDASQNDAAAWRRSFVAGGSPGASDSGIVLINEILTHTDLPDTDAIELYNPGEDAVDISGWFLSDDRRNPIKFKIPDGTVIASGGYRVFTEVDFNKDTSFSSFTLDSHGEEVILVASQRGCAYGYCHGFSFGEMENGVSIGRHITSTGKEVFVAQQSKSLGSVNVGPKVGPVIISEIMYHSLSNQGDFIEVTNVTDTDVPLFLKDHPDTTWKIEGAGFSFPKSTVLKANETVVIVMDSIAPQTLRSLHSISADIRIFASTGGLKNSSEKLELLRPEDMFVADSTVSTIPTCPYMLFDKVDYSSGGNWPLADGNGKSLHRKANSYGDDPASWVAKVPTPGIK